MWLICTETVEHNNDVGQNRKMLPLTKLLLSPF